MGDLEIEKRVSDLEQEIAALKRSVQPGGQATRSAGQLRRCSSFLKENWFLISFLSTLLVAGWGKYHYGASYFEKFETAKTKRELSEFHRQMGDRFLAMNETEFAKGAYAEASTINPDNQSAVWGMELAEVFDPPSGKKYWVPEVVDARLKYLSESKDFGKDYRIDYLRAIRYALSANTSKAMDALNQCLQKVESGTAKFPGCYLERGYIEVGQGKPDVALADFQKANDEEHPWPGVINDIAACKMLAADFSGAHEGFEESLSISPTVLTALNLGESDWYLQDFPAALLAHQWAANYLDGKVEDDDRLLGGEWTEPYFPLRVGDRETIRNTVQIFTAQQKRTTFHFALAIDHALLGETIAAENEFDFALRLEPNPDHRRLIQNRFQSVENLVRMSDDTRNWLEEHRQKLN